MTAAVETERFVIVKPSELAEALEDCIAVHEPFFVHGTPGRGKSQIVTQVADKLFDPHYYQKLAPPQPQASDQQVISLNGQYLTVVKTRDYLFDVRAVLRDPTDFNGFPYRTEANYAGFLQPDWLPRAGRDPEHGLVFLDELNRAPVLTQNACFSLILDRRVGGYTLPPGYAIGAAGNYESDGGGVTRMPAALAVRFLHLYLQNDIVDWCKWALANDIHPMVIAYLRQFPDRLNAFDPKADASPNERAWASVSRLMRAGRSQKVELAMISGRVGKAAAEDFCAYARLNAALPNIDAIIMNPDTAEVPTEISTRYAITAALSARMNAENIDRCITYLDRLDPEYGVYAVKRAVARDPALQHAPEFTTWAINHAEVM